ncbi:MAG: sigma-70 family RNA polymerase sigma factor [Candidatus Rokubacteria bacterium]|nr:sigma-70 family RNA polymerase sigma factor [Candidatus Rokubacteria bacterium]
MRNDEGGAEDLELIQRFLGGEEKAFEFLLEKHYPRINRLASHILGNPSAAEDVAQEVFVRCYQALPRFRGESSVYAWLYRITVNLCLNFLHRQSTRFLPDEESAPEPSRSDDSAHLEAIQRETFVRRALAALPPHYRAAIILSAIEELTYQEISDVLGIPLGTVKSRINFGKRLLKEQLLPLLGPEGS